MENEFHYLIICYSVTVTQLIIHIYISRHNFVFAEDKLYGATLKGPARYLINEFADSCLNPLVIAGN